ncbi:MAG TPA: chemotaxis protein CheA [Polyangiaceae bacterium]|nr:chemotaxis protein CheA [Polyangiaceae bacterium]
MTTLDRQEFVAGYLAEAEEHLRAATQGLLAIEAALHKHEAHPRAVRDLFRALHTLKGLSAMIGVDAVVDVAHEMEAVLRLADRGSGRLSLAGIEVLLQGVKAIETRVAAFAAGKPVPLAPQDLIRALVALRPVTERAPSAATSTIVLAPELLSKLSASEQLQLTQGAANKRRVLRLDYVPSPARTAEGISITKVRERLGQIAEIVKVVPLAMPKSEHAPGALRFALLLITDAPNEALADAACVQASDMHEVAVESTQTPEAPVWEPGSDEEGEHDAPARASSIRVDVARLDDAMEKLSELVVTRFRLARAVNALREQGVDVRELSAIVDENARRLRDLRGCITRARMVPVRELLERVPLIVRSMRRSTGKSVQLELEAGSAELDKAVAERVFPAIVHLVRNAIDHAIEPPAERVARGKPERGCITVACFEHSNTELELRVSDDGRGIDRESVARKSGRPTPRTDQELLEIITLPGFSTVDQATANSGRGMGMDIVQRIAVNALGGSLTLDTTPGGGTTFVLRIPLSLSIVDSFTFGCAGQTFVVPVSMVEEIIDLAEAAMVAPPAPTSSKKSVRLIHRRGQAIPLLPLAQLFELPSEQVASKALIVRRAGEPFAFAIDRMFGQQEIVVRPLEDPLVKVAGVSGATDLGDGRPTLVLDLLGLVGSSNQSTLAVSA